MTTPNEDRCAPVRPRPYRLPMNRVLEEWSTEHVAAVMGVSQRTVQRWRNNGVDGWTGDRVAVKVCGSDGYALWGADQFNRAFQKIDERATA